MTKKSATPRNNLLEIVEILYSKWWFILITVPIVLIASYLLVRAAGVAEGNLTMDGEPYGAFMATITLIAVVLTFFFDGTWMLVSASQVTMLIGSLFYLIVRSAGIDLGPDFAKPLEVIGTAAIAVGVLAWFFGSLKDW